MDTLPSNDPRRLDLERLRRSCARCSLQELCRPAGIGADELARLEDVVRRRRPVARGERLFHAGDALGSLYVGREGAFKTVLVTEDGDEQVLGFHLPGELIGLDALGSGQHRCEAVALTEASVCEVPYERLASVAAQLPQLQQHLLRVIGQRLEREQDHVGMLVRRQAGERIALFLHGVSHRVAQAGGSDTSLVLPMSRDDIARFLGLALETVSRGFSRLQEEGVIRVSGRRVEILDASALERLAHGSEAAPARRRDIA
ncbi:helix-turn-helix domain-containing protein [Lysobacter sp. GX 14042]|uniref:helix-turn-helix domain-containing protein n=1 Tax=Lysobacter sp. GX 14042 TaxID=2907155 RepID=UPI001F21385E|nr:helix-turn-helix domain-containing protein [Lysobacter sp. GX 14042]MCE7033107.1 helix-turn-helix domain-containing protein [Lysobacter sp. GX 14042]